MTIKNHDRLARMFLKQYELQQKMGNVLLMTGTQAGWQKYVNIMTLAMVDETMEMVRETAFKNPQYIKGGWKNSQEIHMTKMRQEIVDMWFFLLNLTLASGLDAQTLYRMWHHKYKVNLGRIKEKY